MTTARNVTISLGPREIILDSKVVATVDDIVVWVAEATEEELAALKSRPVILLVKPLDFTIKEGVPHES